MKNEYVKNVYGEEINFDAVVELMNDEIRENLNSEIAPCTAQEFFDAYCKAHEEFYGEEFEPAKLNGQW